MKYNAFPLPLAVALAFLAVPLADPDLGWHLLGGKYVIEHANVPRADFINFFPSKWVDYHWLAQLLMQGVYQLGGFWALTVALALLGLNIFFALEALLTQTALRKNALARLCLSAATTAIIMQVASIRPQMLALLVLALGMRLVLLGSGCSFLLLFALCVALVNIHVYWIFLPIAWAALHSIPFLLGRKKRTTFVRAVLAPIVLVLAGFISPYGMDNYLVLQSYFYQSADLREYISELVSPFDRNGLMPWLLLLSVFFLVPALNKKRFFVELPTYALAIFSLILAVRSIKFAPVYAILALPQLARRVRVLPKGQLPGLDGRTAALAINAAFFCYFLWQAPWKRDLESELSKNTPVDACRWIGATYALRPSLRIATHFDHGGWCRWAIQQSAPQLDARVSTDGRTQFVPIERIVAGFDLYRVHYDWSKTLNDWAPNLVLVDKHRALAQFLVRAPQQWKLAYEDQQFAVFARLE